MLTRAGLTARLQGSGFVAEQSPAAGTPLDRDDVCVLALRRQPVPTAAGEPQ